MITHVEKDKVLSWLCLNNCYKASDILLEIEFDVLNKVLSYFERRGLIMENTIRKSQQEFNLIVNVEAYDLFNRGGYTAVEENLIKNLQKLELELTQLQSKFPDQVRNITSITTAITSALALIAK
jgi:hypothetical protein